MMSWLYYLLEANLYLIVFFGFYLLVLRGETFYNRNRFYLISTSLISFLIPLLQLGFLKPKEIIEQVNYETAMVYPTDFNTLPLAKPEIELTFNDFILPIYLLIAFILAVKLAFSIAKIISIYKNASKQKTGNATVIELKGEHTAFSFFNLLFINPALPKKELIFKHELIHIEQKHSWDVLFFELLQIINWFNPIIYFLKKEVKVLHEYIADELATPDSNTKHEYAIVLIENSLQFKSHPLTHQFFNQTLLKRRIIMLNKKKTKGLAKLKLLFALPIVGGMLCLSTMAFTKDYGYDLLPQKAISQDTVKKALNLKKFPPPIVKQDNRFPSPYVFSKTSFQASTIIVNGETEAYIDKHLLVNGKVVTDKKKFFGVKNASDIQILSPENGFKKYGDKGKNGAIEINGKNLKIFTKPLENPPPPKADQIKFPPPVIKKDKAKLNQTKVYTKFATPVKYDKVTKKSISIEDRLIIINGRETPYRPDFFGLANAEKITFLKPSIATEKYGIKAKHGAVEVTGNNLKMLTKPVDQIKFPPPIVRTGVSKNSRVVWTSRQLVPTNIIPSKTNKDSVNYNEVLKDCFQIIEYDQNGKSKISLDWTLCPTGKCPKTGTFYKGTAEYKKLGLLITTSTSINNTKFPPPIGKRN